MISRLSDIIALWYHLFLWYHVTCSASWCWLGEQLARRSASSCLAAANELLQGEAPHCQWAWSQSLTRTAQVGHLVMASFSQVHSQSVSQESRIWARAVRSPGRALSDWQQSQLYYGSCRRNHELVHVTAQALIIVILSHTVPLPKDLI
jgi:hypothetical protein